VIDEIETALAGGFRRDLIASLARVQPFARALGELRRAMQAHVWRGPGASLDLRDWVDALDQRTRAEGFHVLHDWDGKADRVTPNAIVVDVLEFVVGRRGAEPTDPAALAILVDYYFVYLLALAAMRAWDESDPATTLDRITGLLETVQGPGGGGHKFADNAETLILIATSHYEPNEQGYAMLLDRARALPRANRTAMALGHAQAMGGHLRFGLAVTYGRDLEAMRADNVADYPWVCFALASLMDEYAALEAEGAAGPARDRVVEGVLNGLLPDPAAFLDRAPASLAPHEHEWTRFADLFRQHRAALVDAFAAHRPLDRRYSPLSLSFNFSQNLVKGTVADALLLGEAWNVSLNGLFTGLPHGDDRNIGREKLARTLMAYASAHPDTIRGRLSPVVFYDPAAGRRFFSATMRAVSGA